MYIGIKISSESEKRREYGKIKNRHLPAAGQAT
jgi:hypothetical protein